MRVKSVSTFICRRRFSSVWLTACSTSIVLPTKTVKTRKPKIVTADAKSVSSGVSGETDGDLSIAVRAQ